MSGFVIGIFGKRLRFTEVLFGEIIGIDGDIPPNVLFNNTFSFKPDEFNPVPLDVNKLYGKLKGIVPEFHRFCIFDRARVLIADFKCVRAGLK